MDGSETQHFDLNVPHARGQIQLVLPRFVGIGDYLLVVLGRSNGGTRNKLVGGADRPGLLARKCCWAQDNPEPGILKAFSHSLAHVDEFSR